MSVSSSVPVKRKFSESTNGMGIKVTATATAGTLIHTAQSGTTDGNYDEIWIYAYNSHTSNVDLTIEFGDATAPDHNIKKTLSPADGLVRIVPGLILQNAKTVRAFASVADKVAISGWVNKITEVTT